jgi:hypothetical protein
MDDEIPFPSSMKINHPTRKERQGNWAIKTRMLSKAQYLVRMELH